MDKKLDTLHELCEAVYKLLKDAVDNMRTSGGRLSAGDVDYIDKLTHAMKSIKTTIAMMETEEEDGYSGRMYFPRAYLSDATHMGRGTGSYADGADYSGRRDSMGRFTSRRGYSYHGDVQSVIDELRGIMGELPEDQRREAQRFVEKMER